jgi:hypothetical protein
VLLHLAREHKLKTIVWTPYLRPEVERHSFYFRNKPVPVTDSVWEFFRGIQRIKNLGEREGVAVKIIEEKFDHTKRTAYSDNLRRHLNGCARSLLLFLDPDTGLEPSVVKKAHVTKCDVKRAWSDLRRGDWLVLYQHARREKGWINAVRGQLKEICRGVDVDVAHSKKIAKDVAFLCAGKQ